MQEIWCDCSYGPKKDENGRWHNGTCRFSHEKSCSWSRSEIALMQCKCDNFEFVITSNDQAWIAPISKQKIE